MRKKIISCLLVICCLSCPMTSFASSISDEQTKLSNLEKSLNETVKEITDLTTQIETKNMELLEAEARLSSATEQQNQEYEKVKKYIQYLYENDKSSLELVLQSSLSDLLNQQSYVTDSHNYYRKKIKIYEKIISNIKKQKNEIKEKTEELEELKKKFEEKKTKLEEDVQKQKQTVEMMSEKTREGISNAINFQIMTTYTTANNYGYSDQQLDLICAIVAQECSTSYEGALAVITCALNRCDSPQWKSRGTDPLSQLCAKGQFTYSIDGYYKKRLNGNYAGFVKQAVLDALNGKRNHNYLSFRSTSGSGRVNIGDNWYFNPM